jgi:ParB family chromosome partitioning protein
LLKLPAEVQVAIRDGLITQGHARSFINIESRDDQLMLLQEILDNDLSVREIEKQVQKLNKSEKKGARKTASQLPERYREIPGTLSREFGTKVDFKRNSRGKGSIIIGFKSDEELERLISVLQKQG